MLYYWKNKSFSSFGFSAVIVKIILYCAALIVVNVLQNFTIAGQSVEVFGWLNYLVLTALVLREAISVIENIAKIDPRILPKWILSHLKAIETSLEKKADAQNPARQ